MGNPLDSLFEKTPKTVHTYTIPESLRNGAAKVGMCELTADQELQASRTGRFDLLKAQYEATKLSIVLLDGKVVNRAEIELDRFWEHASPRVRSLLLQAYNRLSSPSAEETEDFFDSVVTELAKV
jgi:hypothetical protein